MGSEVMIQSWTGRSRVLKTLAKAMAPQTTAATNSVADTTRVRACAPARGTMRIRARTLAVFHLRQGCFPTFGEGLVTNRKTPLRLSEGLRMLAHMCVS